MNQGNTMHDILSQREDFLVIGLTGRLGSGCSKVAGILASSFDELNFPDPVPQLGQPSLTEESRAIRILAEYAKAHWLKFDVIQVGAIIATFILDDDRRFIIDLSSNQAKEKYDELRRKFRKSVFEDFYLKLIQLGQDIGLIGQEKDAEHYLCKITDPEEQKKVDEDSELINIGSDMFAPKKLPEKYHEDLQKKLRQLICEVKKLISEKALIAESVPDGILSDLDIELMSIATKAEPDWEKFGAAMDSLYRSVLPQNSGIDRRKYMELMDKLLTVASFHCLMLLMNNFLQRGDSVAESLWKWLEDVNKCVTPNAEENDEVLQIHQYVFVKYITPWFGATIRKFVRDELGDGAYAHLFQRYGQMIRYHSHIPPREGENAFCGKKDIFAIPRKINQHIKVLRHPFNKRQHRPVCIVVDSIKNQFEAVYLRYRYSAFYLWAITTDSDIRVRRLHEKKLTVSQILQLDWNEYPDMGSEIIEKVGNAMNECGFTSADLSRWKEVRNTLKCRKSIQEEEFDFYFGRFPNKKLDEGHEAVDEFDEIRWNFFRNGTYVFYAQDVDSCICNADVYLFNNVDSTTDTTNHSRLLEAVVRNVSLAMYPGLVRPTSVERCMQIALSAKVNSGCLSRQVGAVVTDSQYNILAIGWNDVPCGEVPCAYKNVHDIVAGTDPDAYSEYELTNPDFRERIKEYKEKHTVPSGLPCSYCFKDVHKPGKHPMRSRAMHAEEKALALCGREAEGGFLFTTSSPCEMCSKNAKNHKIKKIFYIEAYPGISQAQYTNSGDKSNRAELILFSGAVGRAYMQMYTPLLPHKDVLKYLDDHKGTI